MKGRPILFSGAMVRALRAGTKTQTRRVLGKRAARLDPAWPLAVSPKDEKLLALCPYGRVGDRLWVRESHWWFKDEHDPVTGYFPPALTSADVEYRADGEKPGRIWRPSIHMPRWASRITLEITGVRVERLQDISEADAKAEGCERLDEDEPGFVQLHEPDFKLCPQCGGTRLYTAFAASGGALPDTDCLKCDTYAKRYRHLWEAINGPGSWDANPWVWVVSFRRIEV